VCSSRTEDGPDVDRRSEMADHADLRGPQDAGEARGRSGGQVVDDEDPMTGRRQRRGDV
jgi:hypothetical protein